MTPDATPSPAREALEVLRNSLPNTRSGSDAIAIIRALVERVEKGATFTIETPTQIIKMRVIADAPDDALEGETDDS